MPGNDLGGAFYAPLAGALAERGVATTLLTFGPDAGGADPRCSWEACVGALDAAFAGAQGGAGHDTLLGHSLGALMALLLAARQPAGLRRLVLLEPAIAPTARLGRVAAAKYKKDVVERDRDLFKNWTGTFRRVFRLERYPAWAIDHYRQVRAGTDPALVRGLFGSLEDLYPLPFAQVQASTLILRGKHTGWRSALGARLLRRRLTGAELRVVPGAAHWLANEADAAVAEAVAGFCRR